ncbi:MAG TPA: hypothetical protein VKF63_03630 [Terracidiphilus sp.]|nr:hypothetical protein [Terracidiphilus sp.]
MLGLRDYSSSIPPADDLGAARHAILAFPSNPAVLKTIPQQPDTRFSHAAVSRRRQTNPNKEPAL